MRIKVAVCDDEPLALEAVCARIAKVFADCGVEARPERFTEADKLLAAAEKCPFDLIFLDISMPSADGIELAKKIRAGSAKTDFIFVSSREEKVFESFCVSPFRFVRKSRFNAELTEAVRAYVRDRAGRDKTVSFCINKNASIVTLHIEDILYIESFKNNQYVHLAQIPEPLCLNETMEELEERFRENDFFRIHKSYLVNFRSVTRLEKDCVLLSTGEELLLSRRKAKEAKEAFLFFLSRSESE